MELKGSEVPPNHHIFRVMPVSPNESIGLDEAKAQAVSEYMRFSGMTLDYKTCICPACGAPVDWVKDHVEISQPNSTPNISPSMQLDPVQWKCPCCEVWFCGREEV